MDLPPGTRPTWAEIDLAALAANYRKLDALLRRGRPPELVTPAPRLIPALKGDAYGHGAVPVARTLARAGATAFAVAIVEEAAELRSGRHPGGDPGAWRGRGRVRRRTPSSTA